MSGLTAAEALKRLEQYGPNILPKTRSVFRPRFFSNPLLVGSVIVAQGIHILSMYIPGISEVLHISLAHGMGGDYCMQPAFTR